MHIGIIGTGAMATLFASRLASAFSVTLIGSWQQQIDTINAQGLRVTELDGTQTVHALRATSVPAAIEPVDIALVLTKSYQTLDSAENIRACLAPNGIVVTLQNGLGNLETLQAELPTVQVSAGTTSVGATTLALGHVRHAGRGQTVIAGGDGIERLVDGLNSAEFPTTLSDNVTALLWGKVAINAGINPLTALLNVPNGHLADHPTARRIMQAAAREAEIVADALRIALPYNDSAQAVLDVARATSANRSSMLQDLSRGAPTEIDAICGEIVRYGEIVKIPTPINQKLLILIINAESASADYQWQSHRDLLANFEA